MWRTKQLNTMENLVKTILTEIAKNSPEINGNRNTEHLIEFSISGKGVLKKGEDYEQVISFGLPYDKIIAVLLSKLNGVTIEAVVREALESDLDETEVKKRATEALTAIKGKGRRNCSGKVTADSISVISTEIEVCQYC